MPSKNTQTSRQIHVNLIKSLVDPLKKKFASRLNPLTCLEKPDENKKDNNNNDNEEDPYDDPLHKGKYSLRFYEPEIQEQIKFFSKNLRLKWSSLKTLSRYVQITLAWRNVPPNAREVLLTMFEKMAAKSDSLLVGPVKRSLIEWDPEEKEKKDDFAFDDDNSDDDTDDDNDTSDDGDDAKKKKMKKKKKKNQSPEDKVKNQKRMGWIRAFRDGFNAAVFEKKATLIEGGVFPNPSSNPSIFNVTHVDEMKSVFTVFAMADDTVDQLHPLCLPGPKDEDAQNPAFHGTPWNTFEVQKIVDCLAKIMQNTKAVSRIRAKEKLQQAKQAKQATASQNTPVQPDDTESRRDRSRANAHAALNWATSIRLAVAMARMEAGNSVLRLERAKFEAKRRQRVPDEKEQANTKTPKKKTPAKKRQDQQTEQTQQEDAVFCEQEVLSELDDAIEVLALRILKKRHTEFQVIAALHGYNYDDLENLATYYQLAALEQAEGTRIAQALLNGEDGVPDEDDEDDDEADHQKDNSNNLMNS